MASPFTGEWTALKSVIGKSFQEVSTAVASDEIVVAGGETGVGVLVGIEVTVGSGVKVGSSRGSDPQPAIARLAANKLAMTKPIVLIHCFVFMGLRAVTGAPVY